MFETFNACLLETLDSFLMKILFYMGLFNYGIVFLVFIINGKISLELIRKMRRLILYAFAMIVLPLLVTAVKYIKVMKAAA